MFPRLCIHRMPPTQKQVIATRKGSFSKMLNGELPFLLFSFLI